ncbi:nuclear factor of activated T-cells, cytoplasmic 4-like, partial [Cetorhinus maximus]
MRASGCEEDEELDFRLTFGEELEAPRSLLGGSDLDVDEGPAYPTGPSFTVNRPIGIPRHGAPNRAGMRSPPPRPLTNGDTYESQPARLIHLGGCKVLACPSIQITSISPGDEGLEMEAEAEAEDEAWGPGEHRPRLPPPPSPPGRDQLYLPLDPFGYRDCSLSPSSASSFSSRGWLSDAASSCGSASHVYDDVEPELREAALRFSLGPPSPGRAWPADEAPWGPSPCPSPGSEDGGRLGPRGPPSRPSSPCGKRRHSGLEAYHYHYHQLHHHHQQQLLLLKKDTAPMEYLTVPSPFVWSKARVGGHSPVFRSSALPPLDWPLPSQYETLELKVEVQPKTHHRAHYETEGSRGAVKAAAGGHPVVKETESSIESTGGEVKLEMRKVERGYEINVGNENRRMLYR